MKKKISLLVILSMLVTLFTGCGTTSKNSLKVYVAQTDKFFDTAVTKFAEAHPNTKLNVKYFDSYSEINELLKTELMSGKGPDVVLFNSLYSDGDPYKMAGSGAFLSLDEQVAGLSGDTYYEQFLEAGKVNGQQYYLPLSWNVLQVYSAPEKVEGEDLYASVAAEAEAIKGETTHGLNNFMFRREDWMNYFVEIAGSELFDAATGEMTEQKELFKESAEFLKVLYDSYDQSWDVGMKYNESMIDGIAHLTYMMENNSILTDIRFMETFYKKIDVDVALSMFERLNGEGITAQIIQYGAISANTENPEGAWEFLQSFLEVQPDVNVARNDYNGTFFAPIKAAAYEDCVHKLTTQKAPIGRGGMTLPLSSELGEQMTALPEKISKAVIPNLTYGVMVQECMLPYLEGEAEFDGCYDKLVQQTKMYLSE